MCRAMLYALLAIATLSVLAMPSLAAPAVVEPDDYADGAALTSVVPGVTLNTTLGDGSIVPLFTVTSVTSTGYATTGSKVFAHAGVNFWWQERRLRAGFATPAQRVSIDAVGGTNFSSDIAVLEAYNAAGTLLDTFMSSPLPDKVAQTLSIVRPSADIAYISAYAITGPGGGGPFTSLDNLRVDVVPEPATATLAGLAMAGLAIRRKRSA